jgi:hypothetical protein
VLSFGTKGEFVAAVALDEGVGKNQTFRATGFQNIAHIGVGSAADLDGVGDARMQKAVATEAVVPLRVPIVAAIAVDQANASQQAPDEILAKFCTLPLSLVPKPSRPLVGLLPSLTGSFVGKHAREKMKSRAFRNSKFHKKLCPVGFAVYRT